METTEQCNKIRNGMDLPPTKGYPSFLSQYLQKELVWEHMQKHLLSWGIGKPAWETAKKKDLHRRTVAQDFLGRAHIGYDVFGTLVGVERKGQPCWMELVCNVENQNGRLSQKICLSFRKMFNALHGWRACIGDGYSISEKFFFLFHLWGGRFLANFLCTGVGTVAFFSILGGVCVTILA